MFSVTLDLKTIAEYLFSAIFGFIAGWVAHVALTKVVSDNLFSEKARLETENASLKDSLTDTKGKYDALCNDLEQNEAYWLYKKNTKNKSEQSDIDPSELLHDGLKK